MNNNLHKQYLLKTTANNHEFSAHMKTIAKVIIFWKMAEVWTILSV